MTYWDPKIRIPDKKVKRRHGKLLPNSIRCAVVGSSGSGKSTLVVDNYVMCPG
jgi:ABC-type lipoprotein export system ATPase subunit